MCTFTLWCLRVPAVLNRLGARVTGCCYGWLKKDLVTETFGLPYARTVGEPMSKCAFINSCFLSAAIEKRARSISGGGCLK